MQDTANWDGIVMRSVNVGARREGRKLWYRGYYYVNASEHRLAQLLHRHHVDFTPDVKFTLEAPDAGSMIYVVDFVFDMRPYVWTDGKREELIHGIEAKARSGTDFSEKARLKVDLLRQQRGVVIKLLSNDDICRFFKKRWLPLRPF